MTKILIKNTGILTDTFYLPSFQLHEGEIIGIFTGNSERTYSAEKYIRDIFTGKTEHENVFGDKDFTFVDYLWESTFRSTFFPITVGEYLRKHADLNSLFAKRIYEIEWINKKTKINHLAGNPRKLLSLYSVLSKKKNIILDFAGNDNEGIKNIFEIIKKECNKGSSAIIFDSFKSLEKDCDQYINLEWIIESNPTIFKSPFFDSEEI